MSDSSRKNGSGSPTRTTQCTVYNTSLPNIETPFTVGRPTTATLIHNTVDKADRKWLNETVAELGPLRVNGLGEIFDKYAAAQEDRTTKLVREDVTWRRATDSVVSTDHLATSVASREAGAASRVDTMFSIHQLPSLIEDLLCEDKETHRRIRDWATTTDYWGVKDYWSASYIADRLSDAAGNFDASQDVVSAQVISRGHASVTVDMPESIYSDPALTVLLLRDLRVSAGYNATDDVPTEDLARRTLSNDEYAPRKNGRPNDARRRALAVLLILRTDACKLPSDHIYGLDEPRVSKALDEAKALEKEVDSSVARQSGLLDHSATAAYSGTRRSWSDALGRIGRLIA